LTSEPSTATPNTAPSSQLVFVAEAAIPECSAGTTVSTDEVTETTARPKPRPATARPTASGPKLGCAGRKLGQQHAAGRDDTPDRQRRARAAVCDPAAREPRAADQRRRHRPELARRAVARVADDLLEVEPGEEEDREDPKIERERNRASALKVGIRKNPGSTIGARVRSSVPMKTAADDGDREEPKDPGCPVAVALSEDDREHRRAERDRSEQDPGPVEPAGLRV